jgi:uncharacterized coiled-coil protein SlyX
MELNAKLSGQAMQIENLQEQLDTATQELEQAVKKSPKPYIMEDIPVGMVAEPEVEYGKK